VDKVKVPARDLARRRIYRSAGYIEMWTGGKMKDILEIVRTLTIGAAILVGIGFAISAMSSGTDLVAMR
jgi:hypothetical protein